MLADEALAKKGELEKRPREPKPEKIPLTAEQSKAKKEEEKKRKKESEETVEDKEGKKGKKKTKKRSAHSAYRSSTLRPSDWTDAQPTLGLAVRTQTASRRPRRRRSRNLLPGATRPPTSLQRDSERNPGVGTGTSFS